MKANKLIKEYGSRLAFLCATVAVLLFIPACLCNSTGLRAVLVIAILGLLFAGGVLLYRSNKQKGGTVHYFLYDRRRGRSLSREELNADMIRDGIAYYLRPYTVSVLELWSEIPKPLRLQLEAEPQFRPLVIYRMLGALAEEEEQDALPIFLAADERAVAYLCRTLADCGDAEMADYIYHLKKNAPREAERIAAFFKKNARCLAQRPMHYVERNFEMFYTEKARFSK